jgi:hypothetical protein
LLENQRNKIFEYKEPKLEEIIKKNRLDNGLYTMDFKKISHFIDNYRNGCFYIEPKHIKGGNTPKKKNYRHQRCIKVSMDYSYQY